MHTDIWIDKLGNNPPTTEKITVNVNTVDLGYIDYLVSEGHYATRTEFIKTAIKAQLDKHEQERNQLIRRSEGANSEMFVGIGGISAKGLNERRAESPEKKRLICVGMLVIGSDVTLENITDVYEAIRVYGVCRAPEKIKAHYGL